jgi:hypothetical protein
MHISRPFKASGDATVDETYGVTARHAATLLQNSPDLYLLEDRVWNEFTRVKVTGSK